MVRAKKHLGQHFLTDETIAAKIADSLTSHLGYKHVLEVGPGTGALTRFLLKNEAYETSVIDIDRESIAYLERHFEALEGRIISGDFLKMDLDERFPDTFAVIGNFPYNISTQILFKCYHNRNKVPEIVGMFQREVAMRIAEPPGTKVYGILSVLLQAFYDIEYLFTVEPHVFNPPPKVKSAVIRLRRNDVDSLDCDEDLFIQVVKTAFNQRRKTLRNSLKRMFSDRAIPLEHHLLHERPEQLSVAQFVDLTRSLQ
jgi:16S rRNA (adenine1518-N6/adenine1519-N6)-dimethyltransferase